MVVMRENYQMHLGSERVYLAIADHMAQKKASLQIKLPNTFTWVILAKSYTTRIAIILKFKSSGFSACSAKFVLAWEK